MADEKQKNTEKPSSKILIIAVLALVALIALGAYYWFAPKQAQPSGGALVNIDLLDRPGAVELLNALAKQENMTQSYRLEYYEVDPLGQKDNITIEKNGNAGLAAITNNVYTRRFYFDGNETVACIQVKGQNEKCAQLTNDSNLINAVKSANASLIFFEQGQSAANFEAAKKMIENAMIQFNGTPSESEVAGRKCTLINYLYNLPVSAGQKIWIEKCADEQYGVFLLNNETREANLSANLTMNLTYTVIYTKFEPGANVGISKPGINADEKTQGEDFSRMAQVMSDIRDCGQTISTQEAFNKCVFVSALNYDLPALCQVSEGENQSELCTLLLAKSRNKPQYCQQAGNMKNSCYLEYAYANNDSSYCTQIDDATVRATCDDAIKKLNMPNSSAQNIIGVNNTATDAVNSQNNTNKTT